VPVIRHYVVKLMQHYGICFQSCIKYSTNKYQYQYQVQQDCLFLSVGTLCELRYIKQLDAASNRSMTSTNFKQIVQN